jgi:hypothetical protein
MALRYRQAVRAPSVGVVLGMDVDISENRQTRHSAVV